MFIYIIFYTIEWQINIWFILFWKFLNFFYLPYTIIGVSSPLFVNQARPPSLNLVGQASNF